MSVKDWKAPWEKKSSASGIKLLMRNSLLTTLPPRNGSSKNLSQKATAEGFGDLRFYSIRGEAVACMQRTSQGDFRANVALGASVEPYPVTSGIRTIAADIYEQTGLDFLGIDLLFGREKPYFCEINVMPGLEGIEKASGINVAGKIIETIQSDFTSKT